MSSQPSRLFAHEPELCKGMGSIFNPLHTMSGSPGTWGQIIVPYSQRHGAQSSIAKSSVPFTPEKEMTGEISKAESSTSKSSVHSVQTSPVCMHVQATTAAEAQRNTQRGQKVADQPGLCEFRAVAVSPDGQWFATCGEDWRLAVWHAATGLHVRTLILCEAPPGVDPAHMRGCISLAWSPDGSLLATGSKTGSVCVLEVATGTPKAVLQVEGHRSWVESIAWSPDGLKLYTSSTDFTRRLWLRLWDVATGDMLHEQTEINACRVAWSRDTSLVAIGSHSTVTVRDTKTGSEVCALSHADYREDPVFVAEVRDTCVAWSPDCSMLATVYVNQEFDEPTIVRVWDIATGTTRFAVQGPDTGALAAAWSPDGHLLAVGSVGGVVMVWPVATCITARVVQFAAYHEIVSLVWSPCGKLLLAADFEAVHIVNVT